MARPTCGRNNRQAGGKIPFDAGARRVQRGGRWRRSAGGRRARCRVVVVVLLLLREVVHGALPLVECELRREPPALPPRDDRDDKDDRGDGNGGSRRSLRTRNPRARGSLAAAAHG